MSFKKRQKHCRWLKSIAIVDWSKAGHNLHIQLCKEAYQKLLKRYLIIEGTTILKVNFSYKTQLLN